MIFQCIYNKHIKFLSNVYSLQRKLLLGQFFAEFPQFSPIAFVAEVRVQFVVCDCVPVDV